jgi:hypothetical protein
LRPENQLFGAYFFIILKVFCQTPNSIIGKDPKNLPRLESEAPGADNPACTFDAIRERMKETGVE